MDDELFINVNLSIPRAELSWKFSRSSGPGGQSVNTTDSRVQLIFDVANSRSLSPFMRTRAVRRLASRLTDGCLVIAASEQRSQLQNRRLAEERLVSTMAAAVAPDPKARRATRPTRASQERRISAKKNRGQTKRLRNVGERD
ncbi:MAG: alternative ribosome rescue aminoacyl-tRNA hydrolase ArfB [Actinomycetota bacterium]|nr:alternative ribosome rescue aminoacyl-tRNA hydrolase ArfB [Actinomycetota bacterium]